MAKKGPKTAQKRAFFTQIAVLPLATFPKFGVGMPWANASFLRFFTAHTRISPKKPRNIWPLPTFIFQMWPLIFVRTRVSRALSHASSRDITHHFIIGFSRDSQTLTLTSFMIFDHAVYERANMFSVVHIIYTPNVPDIF